MGNREYYVYIMTNKTNKVLYIGVTNNIEKRVHLHKYKVMDGFTKKYNINKLVYCEVFDDIHYAISREKQLKNWHRKWKIKLIESVNPEWKDISEEE